MLLVVGLGNPGLEYRATPHNAGFLAVDRIAEAAGMPFANRRGKALTAKVMLAGREVVLAKPETWMNRSGESVAVLVRELGLDPSRELVVLYDELALPLGSVRIRPGGSANGHNGAKSINAHLGSEQWTRVRIGVGPDGEIGKGRKGADYLLQPLRRVELEVLDEALERAGAAVAVIASDGVEAAMNRFNLCRSAGNAAAASEKQTGGPAA